MFFLIGIVLFVQTQKFDHVPIILVIGLRISNLRPILEFGDGAGKCFIYITNSA